MTTTENLQKAYREWLYWRQKRYDELIELNGGREKCKDDYSLHEEFVKILDEEKIQNS